MQPSLKTRVRVTIQNIKGNSILCTGYLHIQIKALVEKLSKSKLSNKRTCHHFFVLKCHYLCSNALLKAVRERSKVKLKGYCACAYLHPRAGQQKNGVTSRCFRVACEFQLQRQFYARQASKTKTATRAVEKERGQVQASEGRILYFTEHWQRGGQCQARPSMQV